MGDRVAGGLIRVLLTSTLFCLSAVTQTMCIQSIMYDGGTAWAIAVPNYFGIVVVYLCGRTVFDMFDRFGLWTSGIQANCVHASLRMSDRHKAVESMSFFQKLFHPERRSLFVLAVNELGGFLSGMTAFSLAGSGQYTVVFSFATVVTAILSTVFLKKRLSIMQWTFLAVITSGLMITAEDLSQAPAGAGTASVVTGVLFTLLSCVFYSSNYVIAELLLDPHTISAQEEERSTTLPPPSGLDLALYTGGSAFFTFSLYLIVYTTMNWKQGLPELLEKHRPNLANNALHVILLMLSSFLHAVTHYDVVATAGAVAVGILNAVKAVSVFVASSVLFCSRQKSQCYNFAKFIATLVVSVGVLGYTVASKEGKRDRKKTPSAQSKHSAPNSPRLVP